MPAEPVTFLLSLGVYGAALAVVEALRASQERSTFLGHFIDDAEFEAAIDGTPPGLRVRPRGGKAGAELLLLVVERNWVAVAIERRDVAVRIWSARARGPQTARPTPLRVTRRGSVEAGGESGKGAGSTDGLLEVRVDDPALARSLRVTGAHPEEAASFLRAPALRLALRELFALRHGSQGASAVESLTLDGAGAWEARSEPLSDLDANDARALLRCMVSLAQAVTDAARSLPDAPPTTRAADEGRALRLSASRAPIAEPADSPSPGLVHALDGDSYMCTGTIATQLPALSILVGQRRSAQSAADAPQHWIRCRSAWFAEQLVVFKQVRSVLAVPMTTIEIHERPGQVAEFSFKRALERGGLAPGQGADRALVQQIARGMGDVRVIVAALKTTAARSNWQSALSPLERDGVAVAPRAKESPAAPLRPTPRASVDRKGGVAGAPQGLVAIVAEATARHAGSVERMGQGVQAQVMLPLGEEEHQATLTVDPGGGAMSITMTAQLPWVSGAPLALSPERGVKAWVRSLRELEVGEPALDGAFLMEGNAARVPEVGAARASLMRLAEFDVAVSLEESSLRITIDGVPSSALPGVLAAALDAWEMVSRRRAGAADSM